MKTHHVLSNRRPGRWTTTLLLMGLAACGGPDSEGAVEEQVELAVEEEFVEAATPDEVGIDISELIGLWRSDDDPRSTLEFRADGSYLGQYEGIGSDRQPGSWDWIPVSVAQEDPSFFYTSYSPDFYLLRMDDLYYEIEEVTASSLVKIYLSMGNYHRFSRVR
jgi:hypothetical protein